MLVAGVDGCKQGWVVVLLRDGRFASARVCASFAEVLVASREAPVIAVDMPIGLVASGWRLCDLEARKLLGARRSSVFLTPPRSVLEAESYEAANEIARRSNDCGISKQAYALRAKILEVDAFKSDTRVFEVHPEVSFSVLLGSPAPPKRTWAGVERRRSGLAQAGIVLPAEHGADGAPVDDVVDAAVAAWSAQRIAAGAATWVPREATQRDGDRQLAIWC